MEDLDTVEDGLFFKRWAPPVIAYLPLWHLPKTEGQKWKAHSGLLGLLLISNALSINSKNSEKEN